MNTSLLKAIRDLRDQYSNQRSTTHGSRYARDLRVFHASNAVERAVCLDQEAYERARSIAYRYSAKPNVGGW